MCKAVGGAAVPRSWSSDGVHDRQTPTSCLSIEPARRGKAPASGGGPCVKKYPRGPPRRPEKKDERSKTNRGQALVQAGHARSGLDSRGCKKELLEGSLLLTVSKEVSWGAASPGLSP
jgi:hypothetical protein